MIGCCEFSIWRYWWLVMNVCCLVVYVGEVGVDEVDEDV